jgi:hypothetical protein
LARELIKFLTSPASQQCLLERGGLVAARRGVYDLTASTHARCFLEAPPTEGGSEEDGTTLYKAEDALAALGASLEHAVLRPKTPYYSQLSDVIQGDVSNMLATAKKNGPREHIDTIADRMPARIQDALGGR